jgi:tRNA 2-(methylsulfanyl)-N6-isopentenyladenosine37 hydroxylase
VDALLVKTRSDWAPFVLQDFDAFLIDHAACERKASAVGMSFVVRYPDRDKILGPMIQFAREELEHFHQVYKLVAARGLKLAPDSESPYVNLLLKHVRNGRDERFLDRLLTTSLLESRGCERLHLIAAELKDEKLKAFYSRLARAEGAHQNLFFDLAKLYFPESTVVERWNQLREIEAVAISSVAYRHAVH